MKTLVSAVALFSLLLHFSRLTDGAAAEADVEAAIRALAPHRKLDPVRKLVSIYFNGLSVLFQCFNPSFTIHRGRRMAYARCAQRPYYNVLYVRYREPVSFMFPGGYNKFILAELPADSPSLSHEFLPWHEVAVDPELYSPPTKFSGVQDARIVSYRGDLLFTASMQRESGDLLVERTILGKLSEDLTNIAFSVSLGHLRAKNLMPFVDGGEAGADLLARGTGRVPTPESIRPERLFIMDIRVGKVYLVAEDLQEVFDYRTLDAPAALLKQLRGGAPPIHLGGSLYGCVVHTVYDSGKRSPQTYSVYDDDDMYTHHWVEFDLETGAMAVSRAFDLYTGGIEFASGLLRLNATHALLGFGWFDMEAFTSIVDIDDLRRYPRAYATPGFPEASEVEGGRRARGDGSGLDLDHGVGSGLEPVEVGTGRGVARDPGGGVSVFVAIAGASGSGSDPDPSGGLAGYAQV